MTIDGVGITIDGGGYLTVRDLELTNSDPNRTDYRAGGFNVAAPGIKLIDNIIHDGGAGIVSNDSGYDDEFYGNVIYNVGWDDRHSGLKQGALGQRCTLKALKAPRSFITTFLLPHLGLGLLPIQRERLTLLVLMFRTMSFRSKALSPKIFVVSKASLDED